MAVLFVAAMPCLASAQYAQTKVGQKLTYTVTDKVNNKTNTVNVIADSIYTTAEGTITRTKNVIPSENPLADDVVVYGATMYTSADAPTTVYLMRGEDFKAFILGVMTEAMRQSGQASEEQLKEAAEMFKSKGDLMLVLDPKAAPGTKIESSRLRLDVGPQVMSMAVSNGVVDGFEDVTTDAGTFSCIKVSYQMRSNTPDGAQKEYVTDWYAPGIGQVKEVKTNKKGEVLTEQVLTAISE